MTKKESLQLLHEMTGWKLVEEKAHHLPNKITREFTFKDFVAAMKFINRVAKIAEKEGHHPDIAVFYNRVELVLWTHAIKGLSLNDFILAAKINAIR
jgi:4a-hydroxytetrahydrobiopterin dehydratase